MCIIKISKYKNLSNLDDIWTDYFDIGNNFQGVTLTEKEYLDYENSYINLIIKTLNFCNISSLSISAFEEYRNVKDNVHCQINPEKFLCTYTIGMQLNLAEIELISRLSIRTHVWCELADDKNNFKINFSDRLYFYIQSQNKAIFDFLVTKGEFNNLNISLADSDFEL